MILTAVIASMVSASLGALLTAVLIAAGRAQQDADVPCPRCPPLLDLATLDLTPGLVDHGWPQQRARADGGRAEPSPTP